jgi:tRNA U34 5-methylaminomethyl-2-thiouridine-forming methyltransferase MnmC
MLAGQMWAEHLPTERDDKRHRAEVLDEHRVPEEVRERVMLPDIRERLDASDEPNADAAFWDGFDASDEPNADAAFWDGFVDGVRAYQDQFSD